MSGEPDVYRIYGLAMREAQLFEWWVALLARAVSRREPFGEWGDELTDERQLTFRRNSLERNITVLKNSKIWVADPTTIDAFRERAERRNWLAHNFWTDVVFGLEDYEAIPAPVRSLEVEKARFQTAWASVYTECREVLAAELYDEEPLSHMDLERRIDRYINDEGLLHVHYPYAHRWTLFSESFDWPAGRLLCRAS